MCTSVPYFYSSVNEFCKKVHKSADNTKIIKIKIKENEIWVRALVEAQNYAVNALRVAMREITIVSYRIFKKSAKSTLQFKLLLNFGMSRLAAVNVCMSIGEKTGKDPTSLEVRESAIAESYVDFFLLRSGYFLKSVEIKTEAATAINTLNKRIIFTA